MNASPNRIGITAFGCGHYIFECNPQLVIAGIINEYAGIVPKVRGAEILRRGTSYLVIALNELKREELSYRHSEDDLNSWGYLLLQQGEMQKALDVFKLNVSLYPNSWNVYDSYGETLLKNGQKEEALKMYKKSVELNPNNENGKKVIEKLSQP